MRFNKDHIRFIRNQYVINKAFCHVSISLILIACFYFSFHFSNQYLSSPPVGGFESRDYSECKDETSNDDLCFRAGSESNGHAQTNKGDPSSSDYIPKDFIRDKRDLNAQEGMWRATNLLGYLTIIQVWVGAFTVFLVGYTLFQTREILEEARNTTYQAELATKAANDTVTEARIATFTRGANVLMENIEIGANPSNGLELNLVIKYANFGETPAKNIMVNAGVSSCEGATGMETLPVSVDMMDGPTGIYMGPGQTGGVMQRYRLPTIGNQELRGSCFVAAVIRYDTIFEDDPAQCKDLEFYCRVDFRAARIRSENGTNSVVAKGTYKRLTPNILRVNSAR